MKRFLILTILSACAVAQTTTTITGTLKDLAQATVTSGKVTFTLQPSRDTTISGLTRFTPQTVTCLLNASGQIKALDGVSACLVTMNTALQPPGSYYRVDVWPYNVKTSSFNFYAVLASYDWSTVVPTPTTSPASNFVDIFSNQTIGGTKNFTGAGSFAGNFSVGGAFSVSGATSLAGSLSVLGGATFGGVCTMNGVSYVGGACAAQWGNGDIGAQINLAAASCTGVNCPIVIVPSGKISFSTTITFVPNESVSCAASGAVENNNAGDATTQLSYTGSGTAVMMNSTTNAAGHWIGCDLILGSSALVGIRIAGYNNWITDANIRGGGASTKLVSISATGFTFAENNHIERTTLSNWTGTAVSIDHANDTFLTQVTSYGTTGSTGTGLLIDSAAGGTILDNYVCGNCGSHGLLIRNTLGGPGPTFIFANNFEADNATSDGWLFDSSLGSANLDAHFINSWSAGSGGAGIHISGGNGITITSGSHIRSNSGDGILIDVTGGNAEYATIISGNLIQGNNLGNTANLSGIRITGHPGPVVITSNQITNFPEVGGHQKYALNAQSDVEGLIFSSNVCSNNETGCYSVGSVVATKETLLGNIDTTFGTPLSFFSGDVQTLATSFASLSTCNAGLEGTSHPITNGSTAVFNAALAGGGTNHVIAYCNGTNWVAH